MTVDPNADPDTLELPVTLSLGSWASVIAGLDRLLEAATMPDHIKATLVRARHGIHEQLGDFGLGIPTEPGHLRE